MSLSRSTTSAVVRKTFLDFFAERNHQIVPSSPLIPQNDPTLMFTAAGMVQFKDVFTGKEKRPYARATSSQKCIRISGKHNDLENVGVTARHHTFFEMLGNFSFGDYFKEEAITMAWELLTKVYEIPADRLMITVFEGEGIIPADDEAAEIWRKVTGFGDDRIRRMGKADNFWSAGDTGPCGPCTEIHFFHGGDPDPSRFGEEPRMDGSGWTEIWNNVFMQFNRSEKDGPLEPLPAPSVDTGMGLERIACVIQGVMSNYDTDLLRALVEKAAEIAGKKYTHSDGNDDVSMRVIADHARSTAFLIAEGVLPERTKREYVLRRVMRRAIRHGYRLGIERPFLHEVALLVTDLMGDDYPDLRERKELIARVTEDEEVRFRATLKRGMKILDERFEEMRAKNDKVLAAVPAADLYTTFGFPLDLTEVICAESGFTVDAQGAESIIRGAEEAEGHIDPSAAIDPVFRDAKNAVGEVKFTGYEREDDASEIAFLVTVTAGDDGKKTRAASEEAAEGALVEVIVPKTPFYGESGGQVGDIGTIAASDGSFSIDIGDTKKILGGLIVHEGVVAKGTVKKGASVQLTVSHAARSATRRNHSATHLLHWALRTVLGPTAQQKGSRVGPDILRFDFAHNRPLSKEEVAKVEDLVNEKVLTNAPVLTELLTMDDAKKRGAVAIFEEKYGDTVRMLTMTQDCIELCGGTHARALGDIGLFKITSEGGVAAGVRRVFAATGLNALEYIRQAEEDITKARAIVKVQGGDLIDKLTKLISHERELEKKVTELEKKLLEAGGTGGSGGGGIEGMLAEAKEISGVKVLARRMPDNTQVGALRELAEKLRDKLGERAAVLLGTKGADKVALALMVSKPATNKLKAGDLIKVVSKIVGGSGGGRPDMAQAGGTDVEKIDEAIAAFYPEVERVLSA